VQSYPTYAKKNTDLLRNSERVNIPYRCLVTANVGKRITYEQLIGRGDSTGTQVNQVPSPESRETPRSQVFLARFFLGFFGAGCGVFDDLKQSLHAALEILLRLRSFDVFRCFIAVMPCIINLPC